MTALSAFLRMTPATALQAYFDQTGIELSTSVDWNSSEPEVTRRTLQAVDGMSDEERLRVLNDAERVGGLADEAGQVALYSVTEDRAILDDLANGHARSLWMFLNASERFRHAEEVRYTDERRRGRNWDGFQVGANLDLKRDGLALESFKAALRKQFACANIHVDVFERLRLAFDREDDKLLQVMIYREGLPDALLAFNKDGDLIRRSYRPVFEAAMTYEASFGVIEVVGNNREGRAQMAQALARDLLGIEFGSQNVAMRQYDLSMLARPFAFPTDLDDGIERVDVRLLRLMPIDAVGERITLECASKAERTIWAMAEDRLGAGNPLNGGWVITQAKLAVQFYPKGKARRGQSLTLTITCPHGCNLKDQTEAQQLIGSKYLRRWGIIVDEVGLHAD